MLGSFNHPQALTAGVTFLGGVLGGFVAVFQSPSGSYRWCNGCQNSEYSYISQKQKINFLRKPLFCIFMPEVCGKYTIFNFQRATLFVYSKIFKINQLIMFSCIDIY